MTSTIDSTKPIEGTPTTASVRANFATAKLEIEALQLAAGAAQADATQALADSAAAMTRNQSTLRVQQIVRNTTAAEILKGQAVYISGGTGQTATVSLAQANTELTSKSTLGLAAENIAINANGYVTIVGELSGVDTSLFNEGNRIALSATVAGGWTNTKPLAPNHLTYLAVCVYKHASQGKVVVEIKGGFELDEIHDCQIITPTAGQVLQWDAATSLWKNKTISETLVWTDVTLINGWQNYGGGEQNCQYSKDQAGLVRVRGMIKLGTMNSAMFILPVGFRPPANCYFPYVHNTGIAYVSMLTDGNFYHSTGDRQFCALFNIEFATN